MLRKHSDWRLGCRARISEDLEADGTHAEVVNESKFLRACRSAAVPGRGPGPLPRWSADTSTGRALNSHSEANSQSEAIHTSSSLARR